MRPRGDELIRSARWTLEQYVQPAVDDPLAASYLRAVLAVLFQAETRAGLEWPTLTEELDELRALLPRLGDGAGGDAGLRASVDAALAADEAFDPSGAELASLAAHVAAMRAPVGVAVQQPDASSDPKVRRYLVNQLARDARCVPAYAGRAF